MKIGILTFHYAINYGAVLQCYALKSYLTELGHEVNVINYIPDNFKIGSFFRGNSFRTDPLKALQKSILKLKYANTLNDKFEIFLDENLNLTRKLTNSSICEIQEQFDAIVVGSDQVWNQGQAKYGVYFLKQFDSRKILKISYAPSCGFRYPVSSFERHISLSLKDFHHISVRDLETRRFVKDLIGVRSKIVVDPVLLHDFKELDMNSPQKEKPFILTYILGSEINGGNERTIKHLKNELELPVYSVMLTSTHPKINSWADKCYYSASVTDWLHLIKNASFIYTDSFHGVMFSLKYNKPFLGYYKDKSRSPRLLDLIDRYGLSEYIVSSSDEILSNENFKLKADYNEALKILNDDVKASKNFLIKSLTTK